jgi:hypothetical protein
MIYFRCPHCRMLHESTFQTTELLWKAQPDTVASDECPNTGRAVAYRLGDTVFRAREV